MADTPVEEGKELSKKELKALKKKEKEEKKKKGKGAEGEEEDEGGVGMIIFAAFFILVVWIAIIALILKMDVAGLGTLAYPYLKDIPVVSKVLPEVDIPEDSAYSFDTMDQAISRIQELEQQLAAAQSEGGDNTSRVAELEALVAELQPYKDDIDKYEAQKQKFYEEVVFSDKAPDINEYKTYYESIEPDNAEIIYKSVVEQLQETAKVQDYANAYSSMKPAQAAAIFDTMTKDFPLVGRILWTMDAESRGKILALMNSENAAALTKMMEP